MTDVFISYARADRDRVRLIAHGLAAEGFAVWWDPAIKPGKKWNDVIRKSLESAAAVVTLWTPASAKSNWVVAESNHANNRRALVPALLKRCDPPIPFNMIQSADLTHWRGDGADPEWRALLERVRALVEAKRRLVAAAPPPGEAHGAERVGARPGSSAAADQYRRAPRGGLGPRVSRFLATTGVTALVLTAGLWIGGVLIDIANGPSRAPSGPPRMETADAPAPADPFDTAALAPAEIEPDPLPATTPLPARSAPQPPVETTPPPEPSPSAPADALPPAPEPRAEAGLDACASRLVAACPTASGRAALDFTRDGVLNAEEARFLTAMRISVAPALLENVRACRALTAETAGPDIRRACVGVRFAEPAPPPPAAAPETKPPTTGQQTDEPESGVFGVDVRDLIGRILRRNEAQPAPPNEPAPTPTSPPSAPLRERVIVAPSATQLNEVEAQEPPPEAPVIR